MEHQTTLLTVGGSITVKLVFSLTGLDLTKRENVLLLVLCSEATEFKPVKLETSRTVLLPINGECSMHCHLRSKISHNVLRTYYNSVQKLINFGAKFEAVNGFQSCICDTNIQSLIFWPVKNCKYKFVCEVLYSGDETGT